MVTKLNKDNKGFTIIEVLIVLAIAGLIMLIVFLAIPALQRNQRNNARNSEASRISSSATECLANRNGKTSSCITADALGLSAFSNPTGYQQFSTISATDGGTIAPASNTTTIAIWYQRTCKTDGSGVSSTVVGGTGTATDPAPQARDFVVLWSNEPSVTRCIGSQ